MRGRKPLPTHLKAVSGSHNIRKDPENEPIAPGELIDPPEDMTDREKATWRAVMAGAPRGLLREIDGYLLRMWVEAWETRRKALDEVRLTGSVIMRGDALVKSSWQTVADQQTDRLKSLTSELGFSPTSRSRIVAPQAGTQDGNRFANNRSRRRRA